MAAADEEIVDNVVHDNILVDALWQGVEDRTEQERFLLTIRSVESHLVVGTEVFYFCNFRDRTAAEGRYVSSRYLQGRADLIVRYYEAQVMSVCEKNHLSRQLFGFHEVNNWIIR